MAHIKAAAADHAVAGESLARFSPTWSCLYLDPSLGFKVEGLGLRAVELRKALITTPLEIITGSPTTPIYTTPSRFSPELWPFRSS